MQVLEDILRAFEELVAGLTLELLIVNLQDLLICSLGCPEAF
jgi:hypothetical protein